ncbi:MAG: chaperone modulator CbpM [Burkholderiales bacterium]
MTDELPPFFTGDLLEDEAEITLSELCRMCGLPAAQLSELVEEGIVDPIGGDPAHWRFRVVSLRRVRFAVQVHEDLGVNWAGAALALDLLEELQALRARLRR